MPNRIYDVETRLGLTCRTWTRAWHRRIRWCILIALVGSAAAACLVTADSEMARSIAGPYLGQDPPGAVPELFAPGIVSTQLDEAGAVFSPDGSEFYFAVFRPGRGYELRVMRNQGDDWIGPETVPFSSGFSEVDAFVTPDGDRILYVSKRPADRTQSRSPGYRIWQTVRSGTGWGVPRMLGAPVNGGERQLYPTATTAGTLYFSSIREGTAGSDIFRARLVNARYSEPERLGSAINTEADETDVFVAPDESYLVFTAVERSDGFGNGDLYLSFRRSDGSWTEACNMGATINTPSSEFTPAVTADGRFLFFTSGRAGSDDIYWIDAGIIDRLRPTD